MKRPVSILYFLLILRFSCFGQDAPNLANSTAFSGNTQELSKLSSVPVNIFTGVPNVSVPIYNYSNSANSLNWSVSLDYFAGGTQLSEGASTVGLGWFLKSTGVITRSVRGMPDDMPTNGYLYAPAIPTDFRSNGNKYYFDSLDAEQDVFQFSFNGRSGKFFIGKNKQIILLPNSKLRVSYTVSSANNSAITGFKVITEDGIRLMFDVIETTNTNSNGSFNYGYVGYNYATAWYLSKVFSPFNTDSISFNYSNVSFSTGLTYPQVTYVRSSDGTRTATYAPAATSSVASVKLSEIKFPDNRKLSVACSSTDKYNNTDKAVSFIKISDSIFRYGYALRYSTFGSNLTLTDIIPYTSTQMQKGYSFTYNNIFTPTSSNDYNKIDFWGFYNGASNGSNLIYQPGSSLSANRDPNINYAVNNSLKYYYLPGGGYIYYEYELNDHYPYTKDPHSLTVPGNTGVLQNNSITLNQVFNSKHQVVFNLDPSVIRSGSAPISGSGSLICNIKSADGTILYTSTTISLFDLFYLGIKSWTFNLPNGNYLLQTQLSSGTTVSGSFPINVTWENKLVDNSKPATITGGLRVKRITRRDATDDPNITTEDYKYVTEDGKSSGFFGDIPKFDYPYSETVINGSTTTTAYSLISSQPINTLNYTQGSPVGYSRVTVYKGSANHNLGKTVYDFTSLSDANSNITTSVFPYVPQDMRDWALGLPRQVSLYDSTGKLVKRTANNYQLDTSTFVNSNFLSLKLGNSFTQYNGSPTITSTPRIRTFLGQQYYPSNGRMYISSTYDTLFQNDGSINVAYKNYVYDTSFNIKKIVTTYNRNTGLQLETRLYYPYNYIIGGAVGKLRDSGIISPVIATENWIVGDANPRMISGSITDYQQSGSSYIKPLTSYILQSNKPVPQSSIGLFDSSKLNRNPGYFIAQAAYSNFNSKGNLLQSTSLISGQSSSVIMDYNNQYVIAKVSNAAYGDIAFTSFEADGSGNWTIGSTARDVSGAITGKAAYNLSNGNITKSGLNTSLSYIVSVWAKSSASVVINGSSQTAPIGQQQGWYLYLATLSGVSTVTVSGSGLIDEIRLYPKDANMVTNTYEPSIGVTSSCDANNTIRYTIYDNLNRVKLLLDKDLNITKRYDYADKDMVISLNPNWVFTSTSIPNQYCGYDSTFTDNNPFSDTYNATRSSSYVNFCGCPSQYPAYKNVNGRCEQGIKQYSGSVYNGPNQYSCTYHYIYSDCSVSQNYQETNNTSPCSVTTGCP